MNIHHNSDQQRTKFIQELMPELDKRYQHLRGLLAVAEQGDAINDAALWLAHSDLSGVVELMIDNNEEDE